MRYPLHVVHVITGLGRGGAESMLYKLVEALPREAGFEHSVISLTLANEFDFDSLGVAVHRLGLRRGRPTLSALMELRRLVRTIRPDLVQGWMYHANFAATVAADGGPPVMWGIRHALHDLKNEKRLTRTLIRAGALLARSPRVRAVVFCSEASRIQHEAIGYPGSKSVFIPNGFDCQRFAPATIAAGRLRAELGLPGDAILVGNAARLDRIKNQEGLIRAFSSVAARHTQAHLLLAGAGVTSANAGLMAAIRDGGYGTRIHLLGERLDMPQFYAGLDAHVLSSRSEGFPNVLGEAMACGVPCISTDVGDAAEIVGDTGCIVPRGDNDALADALEKLLSMPADARIGLGERARERVLARYSLQVVAERYAKLYREAIASDA